MTELTIMFGAGVKQSCPRQLDRPVGRYLLAKRVQLTLEFLLRRGG